jgi:hypothetical protein
MTELEMLEELYDLVQAGYIEVDDDVDEPRFRPTLLRQSPQDLSVPPARDRRWCEGERPQQRESPQDLSVPPARDRRWCEGEYLETKDSGAPTHTNGASSREYDVPLPFDRADVVIR